MTHDSLGSRGWHTATLHVVGEHTLYRGSNSVTVDQIVSQVARLENRLQSRPDGLPPASWLALQSFWDDCEKIRTPRKPSAAKNAGVSDFFEACDIFRDTMLVGKWLGVLQDEGLVRVGASGAWSLTPAGITASVEARDWCDKKNVTAFWVDRVIDKTYFQKLVTHLQYACARSAQFNELHDLVNGYLLNLINRNGLRARIAAGNQPSPSNIRSWCYKSALSQFRDEGRDALTRSFKGARTEKDLRLGATEDIPARSMPCEAQAVFLGVDGDGRDDIHVTGEGSSNALLDVVGGNLEDDIIHRLTAQRGLALTEAAIRREKSGAQERFLRINQMTLNDMSFVDIGEAEGVSRNRAAALVADLRAAVHRATVFSSYAVQALEYLREEPCSTLEDIHEGLLEKAQAAWEKQVEDAGGDTSAVSALDTGFVEGIDTNVLNALVGAGRLRRVGDGGYMVTPSGEAALDNGERFGIEFNLNALG